MCMCVQACTHIWMCEYVHAYIMARKHSLSCGYLLRNGKHKYVYTMLDYYCFPIPVYLPRALGGRVVRSAITVNGTKHSGASPPLASGRNSQSGNLIV